MAQPVTRGRCRAVLALALLAVAGWGGKAAADPPTSAGTSSLPVGDIFARVMINESLRHDSNPLLMAAGRKPLSGSVTSPEFIVYGDDPTHHVDLDNRVDVNEFDLRGYSSNDLHSTSHFSATGLTWQAAIQGTVDYDTTRTSEETASGINIAGIRHTGVLLAPQVILNVTPLDQFQLAGTVQRSHYADPRFYTDYDVLSLSPSYQHSFTSLDAGQIMLQASRYETRTGPSITIDNIGPAFGWTRRFSERFSASANVGMQEMMFHYGPGIPLRATSSLNYNFGMTIGYQGQQDSLQFSASRQPSPNANGSESQSMSVSLNMIHRITPRLEADLATSYQRYDYPGQTGATQPGLQSSYLSAAPKVLYHMTDSFSVDLTYQIRQRELASGSSALSNGVLLNFVYKPLSKILTW